MSDLLHLEAALVALARGPNSSHAAARIGAHGWAGNFSGLGHAIDWLIVNPSAKNYNLARYHLHAMLVHLCMCRGADAPEVAESGMKYYLFSRCPACFGVGVNKEQSVCDVCGGSGRVKGSELDRKCVLLIENALEHMEALQAKFMRDWTPEPHQPVRSFNPCASEYGTITPQHPTHG